MVYTIALASYNCTRDCRRTSLNVEAIKYLESELEEIGIFQRRRQVQARRGGHYRDDIADL
jgi:hypothetical protein